ncbi:MAG: TRAP transporter fused permease subunit [Pseudomonadota bacterium]
MKSKFDNGLEWVIAAFAFTIGAFHLLNVSGLFVLSTREVRVFHLLMMLSLLFMMRPTLERWQGNILDRIFSLLLVGAAIGSSLYILSRWQDIAFSGGETEPLDATVGLVILLLVLEAARRGVGLILAVICLVFFTYPFYSPYLPGVLEGRGYSVTRMSEFLTTTSQGLYGLPIGVSATYIVLFAIYGAFLSEFGAGDFFFKIASRITRGMRAAGAKTAVLFSTLLGMISGSAAGNVAVTGTLTIPMMKKEGYKNHESGAIEAVVSTGGQIMPPVMGAAAFIMAEVIGVPYTNIMAAALIPALLFFASVLFVVHLRAVKSDIKPVTQDETDDESLLMVTLKGGQYIIPFITMIALMLNGYSPFKASYISIIVLLVCHVLWTRRISTDILVKSARAITLGAKSIVPIAAACAAAGIIAGTLGITGLGSKISSLIISTSGGITLIALALTMITAIVLGMGLPTTAAYLVLATVVAPALAELGVPLLTAHMFVFFYGCVSTITPPVALASYVAAGIAKADINKVGWTAFMYGITCYILPYMFFFGPALMMNGTWLEIGLAAASGLIGVFAIAASVVGQLRSPLGLLRRPLVAAAGIALLHQGIVTDMAGATALLLLVVADRRAKAATNPASV